MKRVLLHGCNISCKKETYLKVYKNKTTAENPESEFKDNQLYNCQKLNEQLVSWHLSVTTCFLCNTFSNLPFMIILPPFIPHYTASAVDTALRTYLTWLDVSCRCRNRSSPCPSHSRSFSLHCTGLCNTSSPILCLERTWQWINSHPPLRMSCKQASSFVNK